MYLENYGIPKEIVARVLVVSRDPKKKIGGLVLGPNFYEIRVTRVEKPRAVLVRPYGGFKTIGDVGGISIAWPILNVSKYCSLYFYVLYFSFSIF